MWEAKQLATYSGALYEKIIALIEDYLTQGKLVAGERLPAERTLAKSLQVNRSTLVHALDELASRGVIIRHQGKGTFMHTQKWGVQTYPKINWQLPAGLVKPASLYQQKIEQFKQCAKRDNIPLYDLSNGDLPVAMIPQLTLPTMSKQELIFQEKDPQAALLGRYSLKKLIADYMYQQFSLKVPLEQILITSGTQQSLFLLTQGLLKPGDAIAIETPSYFYSLPLFQAAGLRIYGIPMDDEGIKLNELSNIVKQYRTKWLILNPIFQNPTGRIMSNARKLDVLKFCRQYRIGIIEDDAYSALYFDQVTTDRLPIKKFDQYNQVIYLGSLSKYIGKNIRIGWMVAPTELINKLAEIRHFIDSGLSILPQLLAEDYLAYHYKNHQALLRNFLQKQLNLMRNWLDEQLTDMLDCHKVTGGFHLYAQLKSRSSSCEDQFFNRLLANNIIVAKGSHFGDRNSTLRLSFAHFDLPKEHKIS